jgi:RHS repeat-associated protein
MPQPRHLAVHATILLFGMLAVVGVGAAAPPLAMRGGVSTWAPDQPQGAAFNGSSSESARRRWKAVPAPSQTLARNEAPAELSQPSGAIVAGFDQSSYGPNDDGSWDCVGQNDGVPTGCTPSSVSLPFSIDFFGTSYDSLYLNNNGNVTFGAPLGTYTPYPLSELGPPIIAPFFADVDTRMGNTVTFGIGTVDGHSAWGVNWPDVGCYSNVVSVQNAFQVLLIDRSDVAQGDFDIEFNYGNIQWEAGEASGGDAYCLGGTAARAGYASGSGETGSYFELPGSGTNGALLDSNATTGLTNGSYNSSQPGRYIYRFRAGSPLTTSGAPLTAVGLGSGRSAVHNPTCNHGQPVNCASGDFWHTFTDVDIPGRGPGLNLTRTYNSLSASREGIFGYGWVSSYDLRLTPNDDGTVTITAEDGSQVTAIPTGGGSFSVPGWADSTLTQNPDGTWTFDRQQTETFTFSATGALTAINDRNAYQTTLSYSGSGQLGTVTDSAGRTLSFAYGPNGLVSSVTDPVGRVTQYGYDSDGNLTTVTDPANGVTSFTYDTGHLLLSMTDPDNGTTTNVYDSSGRVTQQTDAMNRVTTYDYSGENFSASGGSTTITDPNGNVEVQEYVSGELTSLTRASGTSSEATWAYTHDPNTLGSTSVTDPDGHTSTASYDADGNETSATDARGRTTTSTYNSFDEPLTVTDPSNVTTTFTYDSNGNLTSVSRPLDGVTVQTTTFSYGDSAHPGDVTGQTDPDGHVTHLTYDSQGDLASVTDAGGDKTTYTYNAVGERASTVSPRGNVSGGDSNAYTTTYTYDPMGRLTKTTDPLEHITKQSYDGDGNVTSITDGDGNQTSYEYDADNELTKITRADGTTVTYGYDADGNQTRQTNGAGRATSYTYDGLDRLTSATDPLNRETSYGYDKAGSRTSVIDPSGRTTTLGYDAANELTSIDYSDGQTPNVTYTYTPDSLRATMSDGTGETSYSYDQLNRLISQTNGEGQTVSYGYDLVGNLTSLTYPNGRTVTRIYDAANRLTGISDWLGHTTSFTPDPDSNTTTIAYSNGITASSVFDNADQVASITDKNAGGSTVASFTYSRDNNGQLTAETPTGPGQGSTQNYSYDNLNRLTTVNNGSYGYDAADNLTGLISGASQSYDDANELTSSTLNGTTSSYSYNNQGDRTGSSGGISTSLTASGNEITDAVRNADVQGDGRTPPDSSFGIWEDATNLCTNGGVEANTTGWAAVSSSTISRDASTAKFGSASLKVITPGAAIGEGARFTSTATYSGGGPFTFSAWVKAPAGTTLVLNATLSGVATKSTSFTATGSWQRVSAGGSYPSGGPGALVLEVLTSGTRQGITFSVDGAQVERQPVATPYVETNGATATRGDASVTAPSSLLTASQGWVAMRVRAEWSSNSPPDGGNGWEWLYDWRTDSNNRYSLYYNDSSKQFKFIRMLNGSQVSASWTTQTIAPGDTHTIIAKWVNASTIAISLDGGNFVSATVSGSFSPSKTSFNLGTDYNSAENWDGEILWAAAGTGSLANSDAATINNFGNTDPSLSQLPGSAGFAWSADTATYQTPGSSNASYSYDQANRLTAAIVNGTTSSYSYNGDGLRVSETSGGASEHFAWDLSGDLPLALTDGTAYYIYDDQGLPVEQIDPNGNALYYQHDQLGSTRLVTDQSGNTAGTYTYDPYGNETSHTGSTDTPLRWGGQYQDISTGLYYLRARYYDPQVAQFLSSDPIASVTQQPYSYADENPLSFTDPTGLCSGNPVSLGFWSSDNCVVKGAEDAWGALTWAWNEVVAHADTISSITGTLAVVAAETGCEVCAGVLGGISLITGAITTGQDVSSGDYVWAIINGMGASVGGSPILARLLDEAATLAWDANRLALAADAAHSRDALRASRLKLDRLSALIGDIGAIIKQRGEDDASAGPTPCAT